MTFGVIITLIDSPSPLPVMRSPISTGFQLFSIYFEDLGSIQGTGRPDTNRHNNITNMMSYYNYFIIV